VWTLVMAGLCGAALFFAGVVAREGLTSGLPLAIFSGIAGLFALHGWKQLRALRRRPEGYPEVLHVPPPREDVLTVREASFIDLLPILGLAAVGWVGVALCGGDLLGWVDGEGSAIAGLIIAGLFVLMGHALLHSEAVTIRFDLGRRTWDARAGVWPFRSASSGALDEASGLVVARDSRYDEWAEYPILVARLGWRDPARRPLVLNERPNALDYLRYGSDASDLDYRPAVIQWARELAAVLGLPLVVEAGAEMPVAG
jgi:hypothetical protein